MIGVFYFHSGLSLYSYIVIFSIGLLSLTIWYQNYVFSYWERLGVPYTPAKNWVFGNLNTQATKNCSWIQLVNQFYEAFIDHGFGGIFVFRKPVLVICDQNLVEKVLVEDFAHFHDRLIPTTVLGLYSETLGYAGGEKWRLMRSKLLPAFSSRMVRGTFDQILSCCDQYLADHIGNNTVSVNIDNVTKSFAAETISSCSFGIELLSEPENKRGFERVLEIMSSPWQMLKLHISSMRPELFKFVWPTILHTDVSDFFIRMTKAAISYRKQNNVYRNDFLQLMIELKNQEEIDMNSLKSNADHTLVNSSVPTNKIIFTEDCIASQMLGLTQGGSTATRVTITLALFELCKNTCIQQRVQGEIDSVISKHGKWSYEAIKEMLYLDQVIQETTRFHTYLATLIRTVVAPYNIPGTSITLERGTWVYIPVSAIHMDPRFYPNPEMFNPDRFVGHNYKPSSRYLPFGHGPRICISIKYALLIMKVFLARVLHQYDVRFSHNMKLPPTFDKSVYYPQVVGGVWLSFEKRGVTPECKTK